MQNRSEVWQKFKGPGLQIFKGSVNLFEYTAKNDYTQLKIAIEGVILFSYLQDVLQLCTGCMHAQV